MKSKSELFKFLARRFKKAGVAIGNFSISDETYGKKSFIYLWNIFQEWGITRDEMESILKAKGFQVNPNYGRGVKGFRDCDATEVAVSYFKGWHWDV